MKRQYNLKLHKHFRKAVETDRMSLCPLNSVFFQLLPSLLCPIPRCSIRDVILLQKRIQHRHPWSPTFRKQLKLRTALLVQYLNRIDAGPPVRLLLPQLSTETGRSRFPGQLWPVLVVLIIICSMHGTYICD